MKTTLRLVSSVLIAWLTATAPAGAFVISGSADSGNDVVVASHASARWTANTRSLVESGERGLGGGLEFSVDSSVCAELNFVDNSTCDDIRAMIVTAGARWSQGNSAIYFTDITDQVPAVRAVSGSAQGRITAEINIFAVPRAELIEGLGDATATTESYYLPLKPVSTNGTVLWEAAGTFTDAAIDFATDKCYYLVDPVAPGICVSFTQILLHELGHVLGLDHPEERTSWNLDTDDDPLTPPIIGCKPRLAPLMVSEIFDPNSVMISGQWHRDWDSLMSYDDFAGRDFLYPVCTAQEREVAMTTAPAAPAGSASDEIMLPTAFGAPDIGLSIAVPSPLYPVDSLIRNESGRVVLEVTFAADGAVTQAAIETSSGNARLDNAALNIVTYPIADKIPGVAGSALAELVWTLPLRPAFDIVTPPRPGATNTQAVPDLLQLPEDPTRFAIPPASIAAGESGVVALSITVAANAIVTDVTVRETSGYPALDDAATALARAATYEVGYENGTPAASTLDMAVAYTTYPSAPSPRCYAWPPNVTLPALSMSFFNVGSSQAPSTADNPIAQLWVKTAADGSVETMLLSTEEGWMHVDHALREWWQSMALVPGDHPAQECWYYRPFLIPR